MTDTYQAPGYQAPGYDPPTGGATQVLPPPYAPDWTAESPPWGPSWEPPTFPGSAGGGGGYGPGGPLPGWEPPPQGPGQRSRNGVAVVLIAALIAAVIGVAIGRHLGQSNAALSASSAPLTAPSNGTSNPSGNTTNPFGGSNPFGATTQPSTGSGSISASAAAIAAKVSPGVVDVNTQLSYQNAAAAGTGQVLTSTGEILTNNHVINGATSITVTVPSTGKTYAATVVGYDVTQDVAVIQLKNASGLKTVPLGNSGSVAAGDSVVALGNAGGVGGAPSVVTGSVEGLDQTITASDENGTNAETLNGLIETNAPIQAGDSGGPLVNANGQVVGMDTAASSSVTRFGSGSSTTSSFAIPIDAALSIANQIEAGKASSTIHLGLTGFLGVGVAQNSTGGAVINNVLANTPAASAGLAAGDTITAVNGTAVTSGPGLTAALQSPHPGQKVTLTWTTPSGTTQSATVALTNGPAQ